MKKKVISLIMSFLLLFLSAPVLVQAEEQQDIVILYENDAHCAIEGYAKLSAMKQEIASTGVHTGAVSVGDYLQGSSMGAISQGEYIVNIMNMVGYDAVTLGNHEFDYKLPRLLELSDLMNTKPVSCNFQKIGEENTVFDPYVMVTYGNIDIAYIGITTPDTLTSSSPAQFKNGNGDYIYTFHGTDLYETVQKSIDKAEADGAEYVIALSHLGTENVFEQWSVQTLVANTEGLDVVLDGHSHSVVEEMILKDKADNEVLVSSTGTKFANIGKLTIENDGDITAELIGTETYEKTDEAINAYIDQINEEYAALGNRRIGNSEVALMTVDENGNRMIRKQEMNIGDFCADAFRVVTGADIGMMNGGGIRADIAEGEVTFNDILSVFPWNNTVCVAEVTGQQIVDLLEMGVRYRPQEDGSFQQVSGIRFCVDDSIPTPVKVDENEVFVGVEGERRVKNVEVLDSSTGEYQPIDLGKTYTLASHNYLLVDQGGGASMLKGAKIIVNDGMLDVELLEVYITEHLNGVIGAEYQASQNRIVIGTVEEDTGGTDSDTEDNKEDSKPEDSMENDKNKAEVPKTGDMAHAELWMLLAVGSTVIALYEMKMCKKRNYR